MSLFLRLISLIAVAQAVLACDTLGSGITDDDKKIIIHKHNDLRKKIANGQVDGQPRGVNLKTMVWDDYLAKQAQKIANTCKYGHRKVHDKRWTAGQNLYLQATDEIQLDADWDVAIQYWFDEHSYYKYSPKFEFNKIATDYTQIVWANTSNVGCGYAFYSVPGGLYDKYYVCNYGPTGNINGETIYEVGDHGCENLC